MMKTKNIFNTLAFVMLLTTACGRESINDNNVKDCHSLPVTINVTRQDDDSDTRATYDEGTKKLSFSTGDKLFVNGYDYAAGSFAGTLSWDGGGTFSGTIITDDEYSGSADVLFTNALSVFATLLPNGYETYGYFFMNSLGTSSTDYIERIFSNAFSTSKALAIEQFSDETADSYSGGFALSPDNAILNFTITGLSASSVVNVSFTDPWSLINIGSVTTDSSGTATFTVGIRTSDNLSVYTLTVDGNTIDLPSKVLEGGKIYNIKRSVI